jgi:hypothetical protein
VGDSGEVRTYRDWAEGFKWRMIMTKNLFALLLAGTLMVPHITPAIGKDQTAGMGCARGGSFMRESWGDLRLPPVPHIETMPWLTYGSTGKGSKVDLLWGPKVDTLGPFLVQPEIPASKFSLGPEMSASRIWTE